MDDEKVLFETDHARITSTRITLRGTTYPVNGLTSVRSVRTPPETGGSAIAGVSGIMVVMGGLLAFVIAVSGDDASAANLLAGCGVFSLAIGVGLMALGRSGVLSTPASYTVILGTAGGDRRAYSSNDEDVVDAVRAAIEQAIAARG